MAITKILHIKEGKHGTSEHLKNAIPYATNPQKTFEGLLTGACNCLPETAYEQMLLTKEKFGKEGERVAYHFIISFVKGEITPGVAYQVIDEFVQEYLSERYEAVFGVHEDKEHIHGHIIFNSVSFVDGRKYHYKKGDWRRQIQPIVNRLCEERSLMTVDLTKKGQKRKHYGQWKEEQGETVTPLSLMKEDVDEYIKIAESYGEFLRLLSKNGYKVRAGVHISLRFQNMEGKARRLDTCFGPAYLPEKIKERIDREQISIKEPSELSDIPKIKAISGFHYKRARLTSYQKRYYRKLYLTGLRKKRRYPNAWKYREDILRFQELQEQFQYLWTHQVKSVQDLEQQEQMLQKRYENLNEKREEIYQKRREKRKELHLLEEYLEKKPRAELYQEGEVMYQKDNDQIKELEQFFREKGTSAKEMLQFRSETKEALRQISEERKAIRKEQSLCVRTRKENLDERSVPIQELIKGKEKQR